MGTQKFLVTGATGKTGRKVVEALLAKAAAVRALVREDDGRAAQLRSLGAEVSLGDLLNLADMRAATRDISGAYFCYPIRPGLIAATAYFAQAAREAGLQSIVNMSQKSSRAESKSDAARTHWIAERVFDWAGIPVTHLRPTYFSEWLLSPMVGDVTRGEIRLPFANARHAPIAAEDRARVVADVLLDPHPHAGRTYPLYGPTEMTYDEIASAVADVLGRKVAYVEITLDQYRMHLEKTFPPFLVQHLYETAIDFRNGVFAGTNDLVEAITGIKPLSVKSYVAANRQHF